MERKAPDTSEKKLRSSFSGSSKLYSSMRSSVPGRTASSAPSTMRSWAMPRRPVRTVSPGSTSVPRRTRTGLPPVAGVTRTSPATNRKLPAAATAAA